MDDEQDAITELRGANAEIDMLRHVIERLTGDTVEKAVDKVVSWDNVDTEMIRLRQEMDELRQSTT